MKKIEQRDILELGAYEEIRERFRARIIALKRDRRISVGDRVALVFENRDTLLFQIQEMLRSERITAEHAVQAEIDVYNPLLPDAGELSATLFVEITDSARIREDLHGLVGIDEHVALVIGSRRVPARFEPGRSTEERLASVQYIRFPVGADTRAELLDPATKVTLQIDHPRFGHQTELPPAMRRSLADDLI
jgi:hypothetical protein